MATPLSVELSGRQALEENWIDENSLAVYTLTKSEPNVRTWRLPSRKLILGETNKEISKKVSQ